MAQWAGGSSNNQRWVATFVDGFYKLRGVTGGKYVDSINRTADGSIVGQWSNSASPNQQWTITAVGSYFKVINRANGKALDTGGSTADGAAMQFWTSGSSNNQQWTFEMISTSTGLMTISEEEPLSNEETLLTEEGSEVHFYPDPVTRELTVVLPESYVGDKVINLLDGAGRIVLSETFYDTKYRMNLQDLPSGMYILKVTSNEKLIVQKVIRR